MGADVLVVPVGEATAVGPGGALAVEEDLCVGGAGAGGGLPECFGGGEDGVGVGVAAFDIEGELIPL